MDFGLQIGGQIALQIAPSQNRLLSFGF